jgi:hypothetical protein
MSLSFIHASARKFVIPYVGRVDHEQIFVVDNHAPHGCSINCFAFQVDPGRAVDFGEDVHE